MVSSVVRSSLWLSANEALTYDQSAFAQLQSRPMHLIDRHTGAGSIPEEIAKRFSPEAAARLRRVADQYIDYIRLVPTDGGAVAMWVINHESGTVMAVDASGRGGALEVFQTVVATLSLVYSIALISCDSRQTMTAAQADKCLGYAVLSVFYTTVGILEDLNYGQADKTIFFSALSAMATLRSMQIPFSNNPAARVIMDLIFLYLQYLAPFPLGTHSDE